MQKVKNFCEEEGETTSDKKWKEELERYSRKKYQDEEMRMKARKELEEWEGRSRRQRGGAGGSQEPRLTMSVIMQSRAWFSNGKTVGVDGISTEILKSIKSAQSVRPSNSLKGSVGFVDIAALRLSHWARGCGLGEQPTASSRFGSTGVLWV